MKAIVVVTDAEAVRELEAACLDNPARGFTVIPNVWGRGKTGLRTGTRVHPGGSSIFFSIVPEAELEQTLATLRVARDRAGATELTKMFVLDTHAAD